MTVEFGLALENFTPERKVPDMDAITVYSATAEELGFASVWAWDHLFLGARRPFPFLEALTTLSWVAARTSRIMLGTGRSEEHTSELQSPYELVCRILLEK